MVAESITRTSSGALRDSSLSPNCLQALEERLVRRALQKLHGLRGKVHARRQGHPDEQRAVFLRREFERQIVSPLELRHVHHRALDEAPDRIGQCLHGELPGFELVVGEREVGAAAVVDRGAAAPAGGRDVDRALAAFGALGFRIERRLFQLQPTLADHHGIDRKLLGSAVHFDLEPILQQGLQHRPGTARARPSGSLAWISNRSDAIQSGPVI